MARLVHPERPERKRLRKAGYDYTHPGGYFVTICTQHRECWFGDIRDAVLCPTPAGDMVAYWWQELNQHFAPTISTDVFALMPNHLHGVIVISDIQRGEQIYGLPDVVAWFKTMSTNAYFRRVKNDGWPPVNKRLWERSYYDRIIRNERELKRIQQYIDHNPARWEFDSENPQFRRNPS